MSKQITKLKMDYEDLIKLKVVRQQQNKTFYKMALKRSQDYLYFQNKASHYHNIIKAKSKLDTKIPLTLRSTIDYHDIKPSANHHLPHLRQFDIKFSNQTMLKRILSKDKSPLNKHDTYARYNSFQRSFRNRNPQRDQQKRLIELENAKMRKSIEKAKPLVGSIDNWSKDYSQFNKHSRLISRFSGDKSKDQLHLQTEKFLPDRYLKYLQHAQIQNEQDKSQSRSSSGKLKKIHVDKLFLLPQLQSAKGQLSPSPSKISIQSKNKQNSEQKQIVQPKKQNQ